MKVTLADVARASGVSKATASYVLNNKQSSLGLSAVTIHRVLSVSSRLNYRPDLIARALEEQKKNALSVILLSPWLHSQFSDFMVQVSNVLESSVAQCRCHADYKLFKSGELKKTLTSAKFKRYDAVIVTGTNPADDTFLDRMYAKFPNVILLNRYRRRYACSCGNDEQICHETGCRLAARNYYKKFILVYGKEMSSREQLRVTGYRQSLSALGTEQFCEYQYLENTSDALSQHLLDNFGTDRICYIFTQYFNAATLLNNAVKNNIDIPRQIGIIGYDTHSLLDAFLHPQLTTIDPDIRTMTEKALEIAQKIKLNQDFTDQVIPARLIEGNSVLM